MLGAFGLSQKLPDLPGWLARRITEQIRLYPEHVRRFVKEADLFRLTDQPRRSGAGERWAAFQYSLPDQVYTIAGLEGERREQQLGRTLLDTGLLFTDLEEEDSALLKVRPA